MVRWGGYTWRSASGLRSYLDKLATLLEPRIERYGARTRMLRALQVYNLSDPNSIRRMPGLRGMAPGLFEEINAHAWRRAVAQSLTRAFDAPS